MAPEINSTSPRTRVKTRAATSPVLKARVTHLRANGAYVELPGKRRGYLPGYEWFRDLGPHEFTVRAEPFLEHEIEVVEFDPGVKSGVTLVSHLRIDDDPWDQVALWRDGDVKVMRVVARTPTQVIGMIDPGVRAFVPLDSKRGSILRPSWDSFDIPLPGDELAGFFRARLVDSRRHMVQLDFEGYIRSQVRIGDAIATGKRFDVEAQLSLAPNALSSRIDILTRLIKHVLIVEDRKELRESLTDFLVRLGCKATPCASSVEAIELVNRPDLDVDLAIVDVHLDQQIDYQGLAVAACIAETMPYCKIILMSGILPDPGFREVTDHLDLSISGFVEKPFGVDELRSLLTIGSGAPNRPLKTFLLPQGKTQVAGSLQSKDTYREELWSICKSLAEGLEADSVILFRINPLNWVVDLISQFPSKVDLDSDKTRRLDCSPVRDAAIDKEEILTGAASHSRKHLWLRKAYRYESCIGVPVTLNVATRSAFALFAFHREFDHFDDMDFWPMQLSAATIGHVLKSRTLEKEVRQMKAFELMGKSYGSMAHDLSTSLSQDVLFGNLNQAIRDHEWEKAARYSEDARRLSERASSIVKTFREMARGQNQSDSTFDLVEAVASVVHSFKASGCTLNASCEVVKYEGTACLIQMRKAGLEQILFNLLLNAAQQIDRLQPLRKSQGEILVEVQTTKDPLGGIWAHVLVHDNGPGIHLCDFDRIFDMNYTTKEDGCGLGLSISRDIANRVVVGGRTGSLTVRRSILLAGSTFELKLPS